MHDIGTIWIILPAYNAERYVADAIGSVLEQTYTNWRLVVVNDGSTDGTAAELARFTDPRIQVLEQHNRGIGAARNAGLAIAQGPFLCFLDADDMLPKDSLEVRAELFSAHPEIHMADGAMELRDPGMRRSLGLRSPSFQGEPFNELVRFTGSCFNGITWLVRWPVAPPLRFEEHVTQMEDLLFYLAYSTPGRRYMASGSTVLLYRRSSTSSTSDLAGMERSFRNVHRWLLRTGRPRRMDLLLFRLRSRRMMAGSWAKAGRPWKAFLSLLRPFGF